MCPDACSIDEARYTASMPKRSPILKRAHVELLHRVADGPAFVSFNCKPARALVEMGLCVWIEREYSRHLGLTAEGQSVLETRREAA